MGNSRIMDVTLRDRQARNPSAKKGSYTGRKQGTKGESKNTSIMDVMALRYGCDTSEMHIVWRSTSQSNFI